MGFRRFVRKKGPEGSTGEIRESKENNRDILHTRMKFLKKMSIKRVKNVSEIFQDKNFIPHLGK